MKMLLKLAVLGFCLNVWALAESDGEARSWRDRLTRELQNLAPAQSEMSEKLKNEILQKYGFKAECDKGYVRFWGALDEHNCVYGLTHLQAALAKVDRIVDPADLATYVTIEIGRPGLWQGLTILNREMKVPYNATPDRMSQFINRQLKMHFGLSKADMIKLNKALAKKIKDTYFVKVIPGYDVLDERYHDGLIKADLALQMVFVGKQPSPELAAQLGVDSLVISQFSSPIYEDEGELRRRLNVDDHPGQMFHDIIQGLNDHHESRWPFTRNFAPAWTWHDINTFRENRRHVHEMKAWFKSNLPNIEVKCVLKSEEYGNISIRECREGLDNLRKAIAQMSTQRKQVTAAPRVLIGSVPIRRYVYLPEKQAMLVHHGLGQDSFIKALTTDD